MPEIAFVNAYVFHCELYGQMSVLEFKRHIIQGLLVRGRVATKRRARPKQEESNVSLQIKEEKVFLYRISDCRTRGHIGQKDVNGVQ
jgi:dTDP-4-dehydrorhamnose reductase